MPNRVRAADRVVGAELLVDRSYYCDSTRPAYVAMAAFRGQCISVIQKMTPYPWLRRQRTSDDVGAILRRQLIDLWHDLRGASLVGCTRI